MTLEGLNTATIGSFPLDDSEGNRARVLEDLLDLAIDYPNYPQLIGMGEQFLEDINNGISPPGVEPFDWSVAYLEGKGLKGKVKIKASITGPFTLASYIKTEDEKGRRRGLPMSNTALADKDKVEAVTEMLTESCRIFGRDAAMVFIDEPVMSLIVGGHRILFEYEESDIVNMYNRLRNACGNVRVGTHVCGKISPKLAKILLDTDLDVLSHEFSGIRENFEIYDQQNLEEREKTLAVGCVSAKYQRVEDVEEIKTLMERSITKYGENLVFTPACGFKNLVVDGSKEVGYQTAIQKLRNMVKAVSTL